MDDSYDEQFFVDNGKRPGVIKAVVGGQSIIAKTMMMNHIRNGESLESLAQVRVVDFKGQLGSKMQLGLTSLRDKRTEKK